MTLVEGEEEGVGQVMGMDAVGGGGPPATRL